MPMPSLLPCFKAYDIRGRVPDELNEPLAFNIGKAYSAQFAPKKVAIGHDIRLSSPALAKGLADGFLAAGVDVVDMGLVAPQVPCSASDPTDQSDLGYWGDYNDLKQLEKPTDLFDSPRFITPFTRNGTAGECDFRNTWTADMHVGAVVFQ